MKFNVTHHGSRPDVPVVEVFSEDGRFIAMICPGEHDGIIRVISKYMKASAFSEIHPPCTNIFLDLEKKTWT